MLAKIHWGNVSRRSRATTLSSAITLVPGWWPDVAAVGRRRSGPQCDASANRPTVVAVLEVMNTHRTPTTSQRPMTAYFLGRPSDVYRGRFSRTTPARRLPS
ncbi:MAG: hypothetical protein ABW195_15845 [Ilumatobacteraceae bacterium]